MRWLRIPLIVLAVIVVLAAGLFAFTKFYFTPERLRALVEPRLTAELKREVSLGRLEFSLFSGLAVHDFSLKDDPAFSREPFIACQSLVLNYDLLALLSMRLKISELSLVKPTIVVIKDKQGRFNFHDLEERFRGEPAEKKEAKPPAGPAEKKKEELSLAVSRVNLQDGRVEFLDQKTGRKLKLEAINLKARDISLDQPFPFSLDLKANGAPIGLEGRISPKDLSGQVKLTLQPFDLAPLAGLVPAEAGVQIKGGTVSAAVDLQLKNQKPVAAKGNLAGQGLSAALPGTKKSFKDLDLSLEFDLTSAGEPSPKNLTGQVKLQVKTPDLASLAALAPAPAGFKIERGKFSTQVNLDLKGQDKYAVKGSLSLEGLGLALAEAKKQLKDLNLGLDFDLTADAKAGRADIAALDLKLGQSQVKLAGKASAKDVDLTIDLPMQSLDSLKPLLAALEVSPPGGQVEAKIKLKSADLIQKLGFEGQIKTVGLKVPGQAALPPLDLSLDAAGDYGLAKNQLQLARFNLAGPGLKLAAAGALSKTRLDLTLSRLWADLGQLAQLSPTPPPLKMAGRLDGSLKVSGDPSKPQSVNLNGQMELIGVQLSGPQLPGEVSLAGRLELAGQDLKSLALKGRVQETNFNLTGQATNLTTKPDLVVNIKADKANLDQLLPKEPAEKKGEKKETKETKTPPGEPDPVRVPLSARGQMNIDQVQYRFMKMKDFVATYEFKDNVLTIKRFAGGLWPVGTVAANLRLDLNKKGYDYQGLLSLAKAEVGPVADSLLSGQVGKFAGVGFLEAKFDGAGMTWPNFKKNLEAKIKTNLTGGSLKGNPHLSDVGKYLGVEGFDDFKFDSWNGEFDVRQGLVDVKTALVRPGSPLQMAGKVGLDGQTDLGADLRLDPKYVKSDLAKKILSLTPKDDKGNYIVPLKLGGALGSLKVGLDEKVLAEYAQKKLQRDAGKMLEQQLAPKKKQEGQEGQAEAQKKPAAPLDQILKQSPLAPKKKTDQEAPKEAQAGQSGAAQGQPAPQPEEKKEQTEPSKKSPLKGLLKSN